MVAAILGLLGIFAFFLIMSIVKAAEKSLDPKLPFTGKGCITALGISFYIIFSVIAFFWIALRGISGT